jgi:hypothetical protein
MNKTPKSTKADVGGRGNRRGRSSRRILGWRTFMCSKCGCHYECTTWDVMSTSGDECVECGKINSPIKYRIDEALPCDADGCLADIRINIFHWEWRIPAGAAGRIRRNWHGEDIEVDETGYDWEYKLGEAVDRVLRVLGTLPDPDDMDRAEAATAARYLTEPHDLCIAFNIRAQGHSVTNA